MTNFRNIPDKHEVIQRICYALGDDNTKEAIRIAKSEYPFEAGLKGIFTEAELVNRSEVKEEPIASRKPITHKELFQLCVRDGYIDRYSGHRLLCPEVILLLANLLQDEFPCVGNWILSKTHTMYYDMWPSADHVKPISRGGSNDLDNLVITSYGNNLIKGDYTLEEIGEKLLPVGDMAEWDGLLGWYVDYVSKHQEDIRKFVSWP